MPGPSRPVIAVPWPAQPPPLFKVRRSRSSGGPRTQQIQWLRPWVTRGHTARPPRASSHPDGETPRFGRLGGDQVNPAAATLLLVRRFLVLVLLAFLPLQFSWAAVAPYCGHETQTGVEHFGHHHHQHHDGASNAAATIGDPVATWDANPDAGHGKAPGAMDLDCGQCHGTCSVLLDLPSALPGAPSTEPPSATLVEADGACALTRPERPQWRLLA